MKKQLTVALGLAVLATPAFATKARLEALGEDNFGSYFINDNRNQFLNPAQINNHKDLVTYEFGASSTGTATEGDAVDTPRAVGGLNKAYGNMVYGVYFGDVTPSSIRVRNLVNSPATPTANADLQERAPIDLFIGGDAGVKWGAGLTYESFDGGSTPANRLSSNALRLRGGAIMGDTQAFAQVSLAGDANNYRGSEVEGKNSYFVGASHAWMGNTLFADWKKIGTEYTGATAPTGADWDFQEYRLGLGRVERLNDKAQLFLKAHIQRTTVEDDGAGTLGGAGELESYILPLNIGLEVDATSWLAFRASAGYYAWSDQEVDLDAAPSTSRGLANTVVRAGATLRFGELSIDGLISNDSTASGTGADATTTGGNGTLRTDVLMTRVGMVYRF